MYQTIVSPVAGFLQTNVRASIPVEIPDPHDVPGAAHPGDGVLPDDGRPVQVPDPHITG